MSFPLFGVGFVDLLGLGQCSVYFYLLVCPRRQFVCLMSFVGRSLHLCLLHKRTSSPLSHLMSSRELHCSVASYLTTESSELCLGLGHNCHGFACCATSWCIMGWMAGGGGWGCFDPVPASITPQGNPLEEKILITSKLRCWGRGGRVE